MFQGSSTTQSSADFHVLVDRDGDSRKWGTMKCTKGNDPTREQISGPWLAHNTIEDQFLHGGAAKTQQILTDILLMLFDIFDMQTEVWKRNALIQFRFSKKHDHFTRHVAVAKSMAPTQVAESCPRGSDCWGHGRRDSA